MFRVAAATLSRSVVPFDVRTLRQRSAALQVAADACESQGVKRKAAPRNLGSMKRANGPKGNKGKGAPVAAQGRQPEQARTPLLHLVRLRCEL